MAPPAPGEFVPARAYLSADVSDLEMRELFPLSSVFVADTHDLVRAADYVTAMVATSRPSW